MVAKVTYFKTNYRQNLRIGFKLRKKEKSTRRIEEFVKEMKKSQEEVKIILRKAQT